MLLLLKFSQCLISPFTIRASISIATRAGFIGFALKVTHWIPGLNPPLTTGVEISCSLRSKNYCEVNQSYPRHKRASGFASLSDSGVLLSAACSWKFSME
jgi:hypothetical protein